MICLKNVKITMIVRVIVVVGDFIVLIMTQRNLNIVHGILLTIVINIYGPTEPPNLVGHNRLEDYIP